MHVVGRARAQEAGGVVGVRVDRGHNYDAAVEVVAKKVADTRGRGLGETAAAGVTHCWV